MLNDLARCTESDLRRNPWFSAANSLISASSIRNDLTTRMPENIWCIDSVTSPSLARLFIFEWRTLVPIFRIG